MCPSRKLSKSTLYLRLANFDRPTRITMFGVVHFKMETQRQLWLSINKFWGWQQQAYLITTKDTCDLMRKSITQRRIYSAATMAAVNALTERLIVEITVAPFGTVNEAKDLQNSAGSATCSITFSKNDQHINKLALNHKHFQKTWQEWTKANQESPKFSRWQSILLLIS